MLDDVINPATFSGESRCSCQQCFTPTKRSLGRIITLRPSPSDMTSQPFGQYKGQDVVCITITSPDKSTSADLISFGAAIHDLRVPVQGSEEPRSVILGFDRPDGHFNNPKWHHGAVAGRVANRIARGQFELDGTAYQIITNEPTGHVCHGGQSGLGHKVWELVGQDEHSATFEYTSPDGDQGFPGTLRSRITYSLPSRGVIRLEYSATTDKTTPVSLTNHSFFNLDGTRGPHINTTLRQRLVIHADKITAVDKELIPTGELVDVAGTPYDFRQPRLIQFGDSDDNAFHYDVNYVLRATPSPGTLHPGAEMQSTNGDLKMECWTDQPGIQLFDAAPMEIKDHGLGGSKLTRRTGVCLETQLFPDWIHQPAFQQSVIAPHETYKHLTEYRFF